MEAAVAPSAAPAVDGLVALRRAYPAETIAVDGLGWRVRDTGGDGRPLLLLPGGMGNADIFYRQLLGLGRQIRCIAVDYPNAPVGQLVDGLARLLDRLGLERASLLGASYAAYWLQHFGARYPERIDRLVLASGFCDSDELSANPLFRSDALSPRPGEAVKAQWLATLKARPASELRDVQIDLLETGQDGELLKARLIGAGSAEPAPQVPLPDERIAIIDCADDPLLPEQTRSRLLSRYPGAQRLALPTGGHYPHVTRADDCNRFLADLLR